MPCNFYSILECGNKKALGTYVCVSVWRVVFALQFYMSVGRGGTRCYVGGLQRSELQKSLTVGS